MECLIVGQYSEEEEEIHRKDTPPQGQLMTHRI